MHTITTTQRWFYLLMNDWKEGAQHLGGSMHSKNSKRFRFIFKKKFKTTEVIILLIKYYVLSEKDKLEIDSFQSIGKWL